MSPAEDRRRVVVTLELADDPHVEVLAVQALLHLTEWFHHEGIAPARTTLDITSTESTAS